MKPRIFNRQQTANGYTLVELITAIVFFAVIIIPIVGIARGTWALFAANDAKVEINRRCGTDYSMWDTMTSYDQIKDCK